MTGTLYAILGFIVAIGLLTTVHEYGHFVVARLLRVKVLRFSIGFGKSLLTWHDKLGTEYVIASVPLGGYVKMLDQNEGIVAQNERHLAFNNKSVWSRLLIIAAGPAFNIMFAILAYWGVFMLGIISIVPVLGDIPHGSVAALAGLKSGEEIVAVADQPVKSWEDIAVNLIRHVGETDFINITVVDPATKQQSTHALNLIHWSLNENDENIVKNLGLTPLDPNKPIIGKVLPDYPAAAAGLQAGDIIVTVDDKQVTSRSAFMHQIQNKYDHSIQLGIKRNDQLINLMLTPAKKQLDGGAVTGFIGVQFAEQAWPQDLLRTQHYAPGLAFKKALDRTGQYTILTLQFLRKMLFGQMSLQHVAGPISIAKFAGRSAESGLAYFLGFLALVSISLGVLNMLPIPVLDGGHFMFCIVELIRGKALSQQTIGYCYTMGFVILGGFMLLALYNDITRIMQ